MIIRLSSALLTLFMLTTPALAHEEKSEHLTIYHPWARATASSQKVGAVFMKISTNGTNSDRLIGGHSPDAEIVQIHSHTMDNGIMRMRPVDGIIIPAEGQAVLLPGGFHLMLIGLKAPLFEETVIPLTLEFEKAGSIEIGVVVEAAGAGSVSGEKVDAMQSGVHKSHGGEKKH